MSIDNIEITDQSLTIKINKLLKQSRPSFHLSDIVLPAFQPDSEICPCVTLREYLAKTAKSLSGNALFISWIKPHNAVSPDTISRWIKTVLHESGIHVTAHSAVTSVVQPPQLLQWKVYHWTQS